MVKIKRGGTDRIAIRKTFDLEKTNKFKKFHHIIANEQSSIAVFSVCLGVVISKLAFLPPAAAGSL